MSKMTARTDIRSQSQPGGPDVQAILLADLCDSTAIKANAKGEGGKQRAARINQLHNEIVRMQLREGGSVLKEWGDEVIAIFNDPLDCLKSAVRIQAAFNLFNLLFSSHRLHTKVAVVFPRELEHELFRADSHALRPGGSPRSCMVLDFLGEAMDRASRILGLAKPDEILISEEVAGFLKNTFSKDSYDLLKDVEPLRYRPLRGIGEIPIGRLKWRQFPGGAKSTLNLEFASEAVAAFPFSQINESLGSQNLQLETCVPTALRLARISLEGFPFQRNISDVLIVGQSLMEWAKLLGNRRLCETIRDHKVTVGVLKMRPEAEDQLRKTTWHPDEVAERIKDSEGFFSIALNQAPDILTRKYAHGLVEDTWGFFTHKADDLLNRKGDNKQFVGYGKPPRLSYEAIAETYLAPSEQESWKRRVKRIKLNYEDNLPVEWCVHEIMFGAAPTESVSLVFTMDWLNAFPHSQREPDTTMQYLLARRRCQLSFLKALDSRSTIN